MNLNWLWTSTVKMISLYHGYILLKQQLCDYFRGMHGDALCWYEFHGENWHKGRLSPYQVISKMSGQMNWNLTISLVWFISFFGLVTIIQNLLIKHNCTVNWNYWNTNPNRFLDSAYHCLLLLCRLTSISKPSSGMDLPEELILESLWKICPAELVGRWVEVDNCPLVIILNYSYLQNLKCSSRFWLETFRAPY